MNNIVINNFNNDQENNSQKLYFPPLEQVKLSGPTIEQAAELAKVTQLAGGVRPLHQKGFNMKKLIEQKEVQEESTENKQSFDFPDGGWECNKCQNYNFKGRKSCFRCKKSKNAEDCDGKPEHML